ncbi:MAG TPA: CHAP domain-containing protein [Fimbriimonas sp.]|nr:CHAP domain-containing protein [Fimbriimonas sp.]
MRTKVETIDSVLNVALAQRGVKETGGSNTGPEVDEYLRSVRLSPGNPWCAAFVYWCFKQAMGDENPYIRTGGCATTAAWAREHDILRHEPQAGDTFLLYGTVQGVFRACHTGFVTKVNGNTYHTIEGNTNEQGSREGTMVRDDKVRQVTGTTKFVNWSQLVQAATSTVFHVQISGQPWLDITAVDGRAMCPVRAWGLKMGFDVEWDNENQQVLFDNHALGAPITILNGHACAPIRDLVEGAGLRLSVDSASKTISIVRP